MRPDYFINEMLRKLDYAILNTYLVDKQRKKKKRNKTTVESKISAQMNKK